MMGATELLMILLMSGGGDVLGLPPGPRDAALVQCAPENVVFYREWSPRGPGKEGAPGIDGFAADPEIQLFVKQVENAILTSIADETNGRGEQEVVGKAMPRIIKALLNSGGCMYGRVDVERVMKLLEDPPELPRFTPSFFGYLPAVEMTLVVNVGEDADDFAKQINSLLEFLPGGLRDEDLQMQKLPIPLEETSLILHREGSHFVLGWGEKTVEAAIAGLKGESQGLSMNERFTAAMTQIAHERTVGVVWVDVQGTLKEVEDKAGPYGGIAKQGAQLLGLAGVESFASSTGVIDGQVVQRQVLKTDGKTEGLLSLAGGRALTAKDFAHIPADADLAFALSMDWAKVLTAARTIVTTADPQSGEVFEATLKQLEEELELSIEDDILQAFGHAWTVYDSPGAGGMVITAPVLALEVKDRDKAVKVYKRLIKVLELALPGTTQEGRFGRGVYLTTGQFMGKVISFINTVGDDVPFAPSVCLTKTHLLVALHPQPIKAHIRYTAANGANFSETVGKYLDAQQATAGEKAIEPLCISYYDSQFVARAFMAASPYISQVMMSEIQREGVAINTLAWPSARAVLPYVTNSFSSCYRSPVGIEWDNKYGIPIPAFSRSVALVPVFGWLTFARAVEIEAHEKFDAVEDAIEIDP